MSAEPNLEPGTSAWEMRGGRCFVYARVTAKAAHNRLGGVQVDGEGRHRLRVAVTAPPTNGAANAAVIKLLAKALCIPKSALTITTGAADRNKRLAITIAGLDGEGRKERQRGFDHRIDVHPLDRHLVALCAGEIT